MPNGSTLVVHTRRWSPEPLLPRIPMNSPQVVGGVFGSRHQLGLASSAQSAPGLYLLDGVLGVAWSGLALVLLIAVVCGLVCVCALCALFSDLSKNLES